MRADDLEHAVELQNAVAYGLTGGLHSLDDAEIDRWLDRVEVGNAYVNRHTTGAIVRRQPFGGWKRSSVGRGAKTGGPDDILRFVTFRRVGPPPSIEHADASYRHWWSEQFGRSIDRSGLRAESNVLRYRPVARVLVRVGPATAARRRHVVAAAAEVAGVPVEVSGPPGTDAGRRGRGRASLAARLVGAGSSGCACLDRATTCCATPPTSRTSPSTTRP